METYKKQQSAKITSKIIKRLKSIAYFSNLRVSPESLKDNSEIKSSR